VAAALHGLSIVGCSVGLYTAGVSLGLVVWCAALVALLIVWRALWTGSIEHLSKSFPFLLSFFPMTALAVLILDRAWNMLL
jgi:hypothetical protein